MPAFFSRVFSRGKDKEKGKDGLKEPGSPTSKQSKRASRASAQSLLEGKFEAVSPNVSPTVEKYEERDKVGKKDKEKERLGLFRPKSRTTSGNDAARKQEDVPQLTLDLNLPSMKDDSKKRDLSIVYEGDFLLDDAVLGEKRLSPGEALKLIRACLPVLTSRGLETLGVMHPHWHSASPAKQRKIISLFLSSIAASPDTLATSPTSPGFDFESELEYVRSPHDVAAVFRWALRHLELDGNSFDKDDTPSLGWYDSFTENEKKAEYSRTAYSDILLPSIKPLHADLLSSTLNLISRLASHSEANGVSGSKLSMFFGHYLLTGNRLDNLEDWIGFYSQWERAGRALEHIFLASLRDEDTKTGIPRRLSELTTGYPYAKHAVGDQFPRPARFATRSFDALYVCATAEIQPGKRSREEVHLPLQIVENAFKSGVAGPTDDPELATFWEELRKKSNVEEEPTTETSALDKFLAGVLSDESIRILSLKSNSTEKDTPTVTMFTPVPEREAMFAASTANGRPRVAGRSKSASRQTSEGTASSPITTDWSAFSSAGFGEGGASQSLAATLLDSDLEKTEPRKIQAHRSLKKSRPLSSSRGERDEPLTSPTDVPIQFKTAHVSLVKIDESFIDFWSDALLDPISDAWPAFVICQLKSDVVHTFGDKKVAWLVIEQKFLPPPPAEQSSLAPRASSPRPSVRSETESRPGFIGRASATFTSRKRFNFFGGSQTPASSTNSSVEKRESRSLVKGTRVNELGEVIAEEKEKDVPSATTPKAVSAPAQDKKLKDKGEGEKADDVAAGVAALAIGAGAAAVAAETTSEDLAETEETKTSAQNGEVNEAKEQEPVAGPTNESELEPVTESADVAATKAATPPPEEPQASESTAADVVPVVESVPSHPEVEQDKVAEAAPSQPELPHDGAPQAEEPSPLAPKLVVVEPTPPAEPAAPAPEAFPIDVPPTETVHAEDAAPLSESAEKAADAAVPILEEPERDTASAHHGAGDSRFVENIETPVDDNAHGFESTAEAAVPELSKETVAVPETIREEVSESAVVEAGASVGKADESQIAAEQEEPSSAPVAEKAIESEPTQVSAPVEDEAPEAVSEVVKEHNEAALDPSSPEPTPSAEAEETTPIIEEDVTPILEDSSVPSTAPAVPASPVAEPINITAVEESTPVTKDDAAPGVEAGAVDVDEPTVPSTDKKPPVVPIVAEEKDAATTELPTDDYTDKPDSLSSAQPTKTSTTKPVEENVGESHPNGQSVAEANGEKIEESHAEDKSKSPVVPPVSEDAGAQQTSV